MVIQKIACALNFPCTCFFFFVEIKKVCSSSSGCSAQFHLFNKRGIGPDKHIFPVTQVVFSGAQDLNSK